VSDRNAAEALTNIDLYVPRDRLPPTGDDDTYYHSDLIGLDAVSGDGTQIGTVHAIHNFGAGDVLEIMPLGSGETLLLPFNATTVPKVDLAAKQIVVVPPAVIEVKSENE
jgi:16S rRNA processing protein RimM